jgi:hypothetical protein
MRVQPRQQLLEIWRAVVRSSFPDGEWVWGGRSGRNSISDAEQLLCLLEPATELTSFKLDLPDETAEDVLSALELLGDSIEIPKRLIDIIVDFLTTYTDASGTPSFGGGSYFAVRDGKEPEPAQRALDVVDSYSVSVRLSLATIGFARVFQRVITRPELREKVERAESMASKRLTAAMIGLLRSFSINVFDARSKEGEMLCRMLNQGRSPTGQMIDDLRGELRQVSAGLRDLTLGQEQISELDNENKLFECGWSWGVIADAPEVETIADVGRQPVGTAQYAPYLYFTVVALDCIEDLSSERTRILNLLDDEQQRLARALQIRWDLTQSYWSRIARFGQGRWPLSDVPWRATDGVASDYLTLLVSSIVLKELHNRQALDNEVARVSEVLSELAGRARITRRPMDNDPAISLHHPGYSVELVGSEVPGRAPLAWMLADFSPQLFKQSIRAAALLRDIGLRTEATALADAAWDGHLAQRRLNTGSAKQLWDQPGRLYPEIDSGDPKPSWYYTQRVVSCLVTVGLFLASPPRGSARLAELAADLLAEADHLFDQEMLTVSAEAGPTMRTTLQTLRSTLRRAHDLMEERPGTAAALATEVLTELDRIRAARLEGGGAG